MTAWALTEQAALKYAECENITIDPFEYGFTDEEHKQALATFCECPKRLTVPLQNIRVIQ